MIAKEKLYKVHALDIQIIKYLRRFGVEKIGFGWSKHLLRRLPWMSRDGIYGMLCSKQFVSKPRHMSGKAIKGLVPKAPNFI